MPRVVGAGEAWLDLEDDDGAGKAWLDLEDGVSAGEARLDLEDDDAGDETANKTPCDSRRVMAGPRGR